MQFFFLIVEKFPHQSGYVVDKEQNFVEVVKERPLVQQCSVASLPLLASKGRREQF
jgi:hypothetical protein